MSALQGHWVEPHKQGQFRVYRRIIVVKLTGVGNTYLFSSSSGAPPIPTPPASLGAPQQLQGSCSQTHRLVHETRLTQSKSLGPPREDSSVQCPIAPRSSMLLQSLTFPSSQSLLKRSNQRKLTGNFSHSVQCNAA